MNFYAMKNNSGVAWSPILGQGNFHKASRFGRVTWATVDMPNTPPAGSVIAAASTAPHGSVAAAHSAAPRLAVSAGAPKPPAPKPQ